MSESNSNVTPITPIMEGEVKDMPTNFKMNNKEGEKLLKGTPKSNAVTKNEFQERVQEVFKQLREILSKSFGAYGASTIISNQANSTVTKDGYTIMKNIMFDTHEGSVADNVIYNMASDICARLNYRVGDGTTTAIIASTSIYDAYMNPSTHMALERNGFLPRDILSTMKEIQKELVAEIKEKAIPIKGSEDMLDRIRDVVNISSNGNKELTDMITSIYEQLETPSINCDIAKDGVTKMNIVEGFQGKMVLTDKVYINSDNNLMVDDNINVIVFDHKVTASTYEKIIKPLNNISYMCGYRLMVIAPFFDQVTLETVIRRDLMNELQKRKKINLILLVANNTNSFMKKSLNDLAMLLNTTMIDMRLENDLMLKLQDENKEIFNLMDISGRHIRGLQIAAYKNEGDKEMSLILDDGETDYNTGADEDAIRVGFIDHVEAGMTKTIFRGFHYNEEIYNIYLEDAKAELEDLTEKYSNIGNFSYDVTRAQQRYNSLLLKMAEIEVGGDSDLSKKLFKDVVDDSILAAESAYNNGYINGCNVTTLSIIEKMRSSYDLVEDSDSKWIRLVILNILHSGFMEVYRQVLENAWKSVTIEIDSPTFIELSEEEICERIIMSINGFLKTDTGMDAKVFVKFFDKLLDVDKKVFEEAYKEADEEEKMSMSKINIDMNSTLICYSVFTEQVFDLVSKKFCKNIINSADTDIQVLTASIDLLSILVNGNQLVLTVKDNF